MNDDCLEFVMSVHLYQHRSLMGSVEYLLLSDLSIMCCHSPVFNLSLIKLRLLQFIWICNGDKGLISLLDD